MGADLGVPLSLVILGYSIFVGASPFQVRVYSSLIPTGNYVGICLCSAFSTNFDLFSRRVSIYRVEVSRFQGRFKVVVWVSIVSAEGRDGEVRIHVHGDLNGLFHVGF